MTNSRAILAEDLAKKIPCKVYYQRPNGLILTSCSSYKEWSILGKLPPNVFIIFHDWSYQYHLDGSHWERFVGKNFENFVFLSGEATTNDIRKAVGLNSFHIPHNTFINTDIFRIFENSTFDRFDAVLTSRAKDWKRIWLAGCLSNLCLIIDRFKIDNHRGMNCNSYESLNYSFLNRTRVSKPFIAEKYNQSRCGLIFSNREGGCYTSSEYLLCGLPVISTEPEPGQELGGREFWYTEYNSILCKPTLEAVRDAYATVSNSIYDHVAIREHHLKTMASLKRTFVDGVLHPIFHKIGEFESPSEYFYRHEFIGNSPRHEILAEGNFKALSDIVKLIECYS